MLWLVPALLTTMFVMPSDADTLLSSPSRRVRSADKQIAKLLERGIERSPTFGQLVRALNSTDVIVYIERSRDLPKSLAGRMLLLPMAGEQRYLRVQVRTDLPGPELIALIAHELRHALEIAEHPTVRDASAMLDLYRRIGRATSKAPHTFDTEAAQIAGRQVRQEIS
jgi:hypothetical protein